MAELSFTQFALRPEYADLMDVHIVEWDPHFPDFLAAMDIDDFAEAFWGIDNRDAAVGPVNRFCEFVPIKENSLENLRKVRRVGIGPAMDELHFIDVARQILPHTAEEQYRLALNSNFDFGVTIARIHYEVAVSTGKRNVNVTPLFGQDIGELEERTAAWLVAISTGDTEIPRPTRRKDFGLPTSSLLYSD